jgi:hypothetical protein
MRKNMLKAKKKMNKYPYKGFLRSNLDDYNRRKKKPIYARYIKQPLKRQIAIILLPYPGMQFPPKYKNAWYLWQMHALMCIHRNINKLFFFWDE